MTASDPWFKATLTNEGPDLELGEVSLSGAVDSEGANILVAAPVIARSEAIERSFVVEITLENDGEETVVVRRSIDGLGADESELVRGSFNVPKGDWTLRVTVDALGEVSELDEEDNAWTYEAQSTGGGSAAAIAAAGGVGILALVTVLLRRRGGSKDDVEAALPTAPGPTSKPKPRGPPGAERRVAGGPRAPPAPPQQANVDLSRAEAALAALAQAPHQRACRPSLTSVLWRQTTRNCPEEASTTTPPRARITTVRALDAGSFVMTAPSSGWRNPSGSWTTAHGEETWTSRTLSGPCWSSSFGRAVDGFDLARTMAFGQGWLGIDEADAVVAHFITTGWLRPEGDAYLPSRDLHTSTSRCPGCHVRPACWMHLRRERRRTTALCRRTRRSPETEGEHHDVIPRKR